MRQRGGLIIIGKNKIAQIAVRVVSEKLDENDPLYELQKGITLKPNLKKMLPLLKGKKGFVFSNESYVDLKPIIESEIIKQPAKAGAVAPCNVWLRCGNTN